MPTTRSCCAPALALACLAPAGHAGIPFTGDWLLTSAELQHVAQTAPGVYEWRTDPTEPTVSFSQLRDDGLVIFGTGFHHNALVIRGRDHTPTPPGSTELRGYRLALTGTASFQNVVWEHPKDFIRTMFDYVIATDGGTMEFFEVSTAFTIFDAANNTVASTGSDGLGEGVFGPESYRQVFTYEDFFPGDLTGAVRLSWQIVFNFEWIPRLPEHQFILRIPNNFETGVRIQVIPAPGAATLALLAALTPRRRR